MQWGVKKKITKEIIESDADYVLALKGNHSVARDEIRTFFDDLIAPDPYLAPIETPEGMSCFESVDGGHGRVESRRYWMRSDIDRFEDEKKQE